MIRFCFLVLVWSDLLRQLFLRVIILRQTVILLHNFGLTSCQTSLQFVGLQLIAVQLYGFGYGARCKTREVNKCSLFYDQQKPVR